MRTRGFTLIEVISVCVIMAILGALMSPVLAQASRAAHESAAIQKLHQLQIALSLYRSEHDGDGRFGTAAEMGLPAYNQLKLRGVMQAVSPDADLWKPACGTHPDTWQGSELQYIYPPDESPQCAAYYSKHGEESILLVDENCTSPSIRLKALFQRKVLIGVRLDGTVSKKITDGYPDNVDNWH